VRVKRGAIPSPLNLKSRIPPHSKSRATRDVIEARTTRTPRARSAAELCKSAHLSTSPDVIRRIWRAHGPVEAQVGEASLNQLEDVKSRLRAAAYTSRGVDLRRLFAFLDKDHVGGIDFETFTRAVRRSRVTQKSLSDETLWWVFKLIDDDHSGTVEMDEFISFMGDAEPSAGTRGVTGEGALMVKVNALVPTAEEMNALKRKIKASSYTLGGVSLQKYFQFVDTDGNGLVDVNEFRNMMRRHKHTDVKFSDEKIGVLFDCMDEDGSGEIEMEELVSFIEENKYDPVVATRMVRDRLIAERKKAKQAKQGAAVAALTNVKKPPIVVMQKTPKNWKSAVAADIRPHHIYLVIHYSSIRNLLCF